MRTINNQSLQITATTILPPIRVVPILTNSRTIPPPIRVVPILSNSRTIPRIKISTCLHILKNQRIGRPNRSKLNFLAGLMVTLEKRQICLEVKIVTTSYPRSKRSVSTLTNNFALASKLSMRTVILARASEPTPQISM